MINLFGRNVNIKNYDCTPIFSGEQSESYLHGKKNITLYVQVTPNCNAHCKFCNTRQPSGDFDLDKLYEIIKELSTRDDIRLKRTAITGGEPLLCPDRVIDIALMGVNPTLNTNGFNLELLKEVAPYMDTIYISKHHYDNQKHNEILGIETPTMCEIYDYALSAKTIINCTWQKDGLNSVEDLQRMLDKVAMFSFKELHINALMPLNKYCDETYTDTSEIERWAEQFANRFGDGFLYDRRRCRCLQFYYTNKYNSIPCIIKHISDVSDMDCCRQLVYDGEYLYDGFHKNNIIY